MFGLKDVSLEKIRLGGDTVYLSEFPIRTDKVFSYELVHLRNGNYLVTKRNLTRGETKGTLLSDKALPVKEYIPSEVVCVSRRDYMFGSEEEFLSEGF